MFLNKFDTTSSSRAAASDDDALSDGSDDDSVVVPIPSIRAQHPSTLPWVEK